MQNNNDLVKIDKKKVKVAHTERMVPELIPVFSVSLQVT